MLGKFIFYPAKRMHNSINNKSYSASLSKDGPGTNLERCALEVFLDLYGFSGVVGVPNANATLIHFLSLVRSSQFLR